MSALKDLPRFYHPDCNTGSELVLSDDEAQHVRVLRLKSGEEVHAMNGKGKLFAAHIAGSSKHPSLQVGECIAQAEAALHEITMLVAPTKNIARFEWVIEKATEVGVARIIPISCEHSERMRLNVDRLIRIAVSAAKQSKDLFIPQISELLSFNEAITQTADHRWIAHCMDAEKVPLSALSAAAGSQHIAIGPEGDFSLEEVQFAESLGYQALSLGEKRLRTETAAITALIAATILHS